MQNAEFSYRHLDEHGNYNRNLVWEDASGQKFIVGVAEKPDKKGVYKVRTSFDTTEEKFARKFLEAIELCGGINAVKIIEDHAAVGRVLRTTRRAWAQARQQVRNPQLQSFIAGSPTILQPRRPTPALRLSNPLATLRGLWPCAGAAMVWTSPAASEALALTSTSRPCLCSAPLSPYLAKLRALLAFVGTFCGRATMSGLSGRLLQFTQTNPLFVLAHPLFDVAFEPDLFGCHLKPHDAPPSFATVCFALGSSAPKLPLR
jgi:hypothetical protein